MTASRSRLLLTCAATAGAAVLAAATATAPALTVRATPKRITAAGVGAVKLGATYTSLRAAGLEDVETRRAFVHSTRSVIDPGGQKIDATDKL
jgi:hypothetical protein